MFAHNNSEIDYFKLAVVNSLMIQENLGIKNITVVTDKFTADYAEKSLGFKLLDQAFDKIIIVDKDKAYIGAGNRRFRDTSHDQKLLPFYNVNRCDAYDLSPYDETIMIDADYLIMSDVLNTCWDDENSNRHVMYDVMMNWEYQDIMFEREDPTLHRLGEFGITMYWATVVYWKKNAYSKAFFDVVKHVRDNKPYYQDLYQWKGNLYRNDYSFSIAAHTMAGFVDKAFPQLPIGKLYKTFDTDDIHSVRGKNDLLLYLEKPKYFGEFMMCRWKDTDLHVMNKWAINRISDQLLEIYG